MLHIYGVGAIYEEFILHKGVKKIKFIENYFTNLIQSILKEMINL